MRKFYSIVLMAAALLVGTNAWAISNFSELKTALEGAADGATITLDAEINEVITATDASWYGVKLGTEAENGTAKYITLDLNGKDINITSNASKATQVLYPFVLTKGGLNVINSSATLAKITVSVGKNSTAQGSNVFTVYGSYDYSKDPKAAKPFSHLQIGKNVMVSTNNGTVIAVDRYIGGGVATYKTDYFKSGYGFAFGARVDVEGTLISQGGTKCYGIKTNGNLAYPADTNPGKKGTAKNTYDWATADYAAHIADSASIAHVPFVHVHKGAVINSDLLIQKSAALYCSGYANWLIEGICDGNIGVSVSSGDIDINDATITSSAETHIAPTNAGSVSGAGSAIVINSRDAYAGAVDVTVSGNTEVSAKSGFAMEEAVNTTVDPVSGEKETKVEGITITGGTFKGGEDPTTHEAQPAIVVTGKTADDAEVVVLGGNVVNGAQVGENGGIEEITPTSVHTTEVIIDGKKVTVISEGVPPTGSANVTGATGSVKWTGAAETIYATLTLDELEINEATAQVLTIADGATLNVGRVVMGEKAQIIVNAGAKLIVNGEQGFVAPVASNIVLKNEEGKRSIFLFNPAVTSNRHPNATFDILSYSWRASSTEAQSEVFAIPTHNAIKSVECLNAGKYGYIQVYGSNGTWENIGFTDDVPFPYAKLNKPFAAYALIAYRAQNEDPLSFRFGGELVGNDNATLTSNMTWSFFANSYTAEVDLDKFLAGLGVSAQSVTPYIYIARVNGNGYWYWEAIGAEELDDDVQNLLPTKLQPMQGFLLFNKEKQVESNAINYKNMVYDPAIAEIEAAKNGNGAPARRVAANNNTAKMYVVVTSEAGAYDNVKLRETENAKYAEKYMNDDVNIYVTAEEKSAIFATEDLENTYVGFSTVKGGKFTISFANVDGKEFTLVDHETGARVEIAEGNTYEFTADANSVNDYRFEIVGRANMPTAIENTEAVKSAKGVYTITGQYVGEMNVWNALPAGVYVVNGEKRVK